MLAYTASLTLTLSALLLRIYTVPQQDLLAYELNLAHQLQDPRVRAVLAEGVVE